MNESGKFNVYLADPSAPKIPDVARGYMAFGDLLQPDAIVLAKNSWGILAENIERDKAEHLTTSFEKSGLKTIMVCVPEIAPVPDAWAFNHLSFDVDRLSMRGRLDRENAVAYSDIRVISAAAYSLSTVTERKVKGSASAGAMAANLGFMMMTGIPMKIVPTTKDTVKRESKTEFLYSLSILGGEPMGRFDMESNLDYGFLGAEKTYNSFGNFRLFVTKLAQKAPQALLSKGVQTLLGNGMVTQMGYEGPHEVERELRWLTALLGRIPPR
jgi:hypothetical protein